MGEPRKDQYDQARHFYGVRRRITLVLIIGFTPFAAAAYLLAPTHRWVLLVSLPLAALWGCLAWWAIWWTGEFRCPRCRRRYGSLASRAFLVKWSRGLFEDVCPNCRLAKAAESTSDAAVD